MSGLFFFFYISTETSYNRNTNHCSVLFPAVQFGSDVYVKFSTKGFMFLSDEFSLKLHVKDLLDTGDDAVHRRETLNK